MRAYERTTNGIEFADEIASSEGANFVLIPTAAYTAEQVKEAIREIFDNRDVVYLKVAHERDWDERYRSEIFAHPVTRSLKWYEINADDYELLRRERLKGTSVDDYVRQYVVPFSVETRLRNFKKYGNKMFEI